MDPIEAVRAAGSRDWSDDLEAISALLGAAGCWTIATTKRRLVARDLVKRKASASDVLTMLLHYLGRGRSAAWIATAMTLNPEKVWRARSEGAVEQVAGTIRWIQRARIDDLIAGITAAMADRISRDDEAQTIVPASAAVRRASRSA